MTDQPSRLNPANGLTLLRLVLVPVFAWILLSHPHDLWWRLGSTALFGLAIATDALDGRIARKYNLITDFGKLWDSIADKALTGMAFIGLSILGELPWWITVLVLAREWGITWLGQAQVDLLPVEAGERGDSNQRTFEFANVGLNLGGDELEHLGAGGEPLGRRLLAQNRDAGFEVGRLNVGHQSPFEPAA